MGQVLHPSCSMHLGDDTVRNCRWGGKIFRQARNISAHLKLVFLARRKERRSLTRVSGGRRGDVSLASEIAHSSDEWAPCALRGEGVTKAGCSTPCTTILTRSAGCSAPRPRRSTG